MNDFWNTRRPLLEVLTILVLLLGFFCTYSILDFSVVLDTELRKPDARAYLGLPEHEADGPEIAEGSDLLEEENPLADSLSISSDTLAFRPKDFDAADAATWYPVRDSSSQYILLTGDSMSEELMFAFKKYAKYNGHKLKTRIWYSSTTPQWGKAEKLTKFIQQYRPSFILFTLGANELFIRSIADRERYIKSIIAEADRYKIPFVWVGPPNWKDDTGINDLIQKNVGNDRFFLSKDLDFQRKSDGAHPTRKASAVWADTIARWVMTKSRYKGQILLRDPKLKGKPRTYEANQSADTIAARDEYSPVAVLTDKKASETKNSAQSVKGPKSSENSANKPPAKPQKNNGDSLKAPPGDSSKGAVVTKDSSKNTSKQLPPSPSRPEDFESEKPILRDSSRQDK